MKFRKKSGMNEVTVHDFSIALLGSFNTRICVVLEIAADKQTKKRKGTQLIDLIRIAIVHLIIGGEIFCDSQR